MTTEEGVNSWLDDAEDRIGSLEDKVAENTQSEQQKKEEKMRIFKRPLGQHEA